MLGLVKDEKSSNCQTQIRVERESAGSELLALRAGTEHYTIYGGPIIGGPKTEKPQENGMKSENRT